MDDPCHIRAATPADLDAVAAIEQRVFPDPWSRESFRRLLGGLALVAEGDDGVDGYLFALWVDDESEILNVAVRPEVRRRGIARRLMARALERLADAGVRHVFLEVRESNAAARAFYDRQGFRPVGRRRGYYRQPREDALVLAFPLATPGQAATPRRD
jgi:ribosomal-protein-alanine N-acetyltransferase